ncbi:NAD(P)/FAD-dependent oxidoreductase [Cereibacter sphaeroides]|uniref:flavin-containing monooxygenase n=1 Tax=Cereibacter sphaeroides TaxID=1063 RepID=UPI001F3305EE|nr:NAD(P)/FAD-dependent oxidoreductase [Cereibacter sphaeroides]MCE6960723.1 NAD(P)/FAD-dependent oxidoreductase [Cereibacter sphaeroides]MCE6974399.1 NAD(P)/FAD-dependent oxidoreductase [Cereibacter sphaeroides]
MLDQSENLALAALVAELERALVAQDAEGVAECFLETGFWRDLAAFTWNIKTCEGKGQIRDMAAAQLSAIAPQALALDPAEMVTAADGVTEGWLTFETATGRGTGHIRMKDGKVWTLLTALHELKGHEEPRRIRRPMGAEHGHDPNRKTWKEKREEEAKRLGYEEQPYVLIIGGGQGGIALGARLRQLGVPTIIVEKNERPGDSWRRRYKSLCLHDPVWYDHLPYIPFPDNWPVFAPKDKIGDWLEMYTRVMELNYWSSTTAKSARYDEAAKEWTVVVDRNGEEVVLRPKQLVLATGMSGKANVPVIPGQDIFKGEQQHSSQHPGPDAYRGKKVVVIGSNNSAHDICAALWEGGADVTMVQRSSTHIVKSDSLMEVCLSGLYSEQAVANGIDHEKADMIFASVPYRIMADFHVPQYQEIQRRDADFYAALEKAGFMLDFGDDGSGLFMKYLRRGSGYYIDVGACDLVIDGSIKLKSGSDVSHLTESSVVLKDGTELPADLVVYATGYGSMNGWAADLISPEVADRVGKCWGLGSDTTKDPGPWEGEQRNMWKPTMQEGLWFHGGNLHQSRHYSRYLSLQLKARQAGIDTPVWGLEAPHHLR